jgi:hypothetical protein
LAFHSTYWSCSKFADWLRGTDKPQAETSEGWYTWRKASKKAHPIRFWLVEEGLDYIQDFITWPIRKIYDVKYYINNRYITRTHCLTAHSRDISPGQWRDVGNRFLPCLFNELVDFVEVELAWWHIAWADKADSAKYNPPFYATGWFRWRTWRCKQAGLDNLDWQRKLIHDDEYCKDEEYYMKPTQQAVKAQEILDLYNWWTIERPKRVDPHDASGWSAYCEERREQRDEDGEELPFMGYEKTPEEKERVNKMLDDCHKIEAAHEQEDEEMMIRLIKVRHGLWT